MSVRLKEEAAINALKLIQTAKSQSTRDHNIIKDESAHKIKSSSQDKSD